MIFLDNLYKINVVEKKFICCWIVWWIFVLYKNISILRGQETFSLCKIFVVDADVVDQEDAIISTIRRVQLVYKFSIQNLSYWMYFEMLEF